MLSRPPSQARSAIMRLLARTAITIALLTCASHATAAQPLRYYPSGLIYEYRWKLLDQALSHSTGTEAPPQLSAYPEDVSQNRAMQLLQSGEIDVLALGTNAEREASMQPIKIDILAGIVGFRVLVIRAEDKQRIAGLDDAALRKQLVFGMNSQWADLPIMRANGYAVEASANYENLFSMLASGRFDAFPRGLNEAARELDERKTRYPQLAVEQSKALFFPFPIYFWVRKGNTALARRIEHGLKLAQADGSFRKLFESYHAAEIAAMKSEKRHVIRLDSPILPAGTPAPDTSWWWRP